jgi:hypothetical protein
MSNSATASCERCGRLRRSTSRQRKAPPRRCQTGQDPARRTAGARLPARAILTLRQSSPARGRAHLPAACGESTRTTNRQGISNFQKSRKISGVIQLTLPRLMAPESLPATKGRPAANLPIVLRASQWGMSKTWRSALRQDMALPSTRAMHRSIRPWSIRGRPSTTP